MRAALPADDEVVPVLTMVHVEYGVPKYRDWLSAILAIVFGTHVG